MNKRKRWLLAVFVLVAAVLVFILISDSSDNIESTETNTTNDQAPVAAIGGESSYGDSTVLEEYKGDDISTILSSDATDDEKGESLYAEGRNRQVTALHAKALEFFRAGLSLQINADLRDIMEYQAYISAVESNDEAAIAEIGPELSAEDRTLIESISNSQ